MGEPDPTPASPSSWRDVYTLVQDVEGRLAKGLDAVAESMRSTAVDHEARLRDLERSGSPEARMATAASAANAIRIAAIETILSAGIERRSGQLSILTYGQKAVVTIVLISNGVLALIVFLYNAAP